jgi:hypothetical protein
MVKILFSVYTHLHCGGILLLKSHFPVSVSLHGSFLNKNSTSFPQGHSLLACFQPWTLIADISDRHLINYHGSDEYYFAPRAFSFIKIYTCSIQVWPITKLVQFNLIWGHVQAWKFFFSQIQNLTLTITNIWIS